jgi:DNA-binding ferritin-like protein
VTLFQPHPTPTQQWQWADTLARMTKEDSPHVGQMEQVPTSPEPDHCLCDQLVVLCSYLLALRDQAHLIHLNYIGTDFISVHAYLKERYEEHLDHFDTIAEYVRAYGKMMPMSINELRNAYPDFNGKECICAYLENITKLTDLTRAIEKTATAERSIDVANSLAEIAAAAGKTAWFLRLTTGEQT